MNLDNRVLAIAVIIVVLAGAAGFYLMSRGGLEFIDGYAIANPVGGGGVFLTVKNNNDQTVCLVKAEFPDYPDAKVELHQTVIDERGIAKMQPVEKICAEPGGLIELKHGGYHIMFYNVKLDPGTTLKVKLYFDNGDELLVEVPVKAKGSMG